MITSTNTATSTSFVLDGLSAQLVAIEVSLSPGLPLFTVTGFKDAATRELRERVRSAILNEGCEFPQLRITVDASLPDSRHSSPGLDLAVATALLIASGQLEALDFESTAIFGELSLDGSVRPIRGILALLGAAKDAGFARAIVPLGNADHAVLVDEIEVFSVARLTDLAVPERLTPLSAAHAFSRAPQHDGPDLGDLRGHPVAIRALEIAAAGGHNLMLVGPPGCGKTMLARRLPSILPELSPAEALEVTSIASVAGHYGASGLITRRPFRAPHHTISTAGLVGGGSIPTPGEVTLAHNGVLFLDEVTEFSRRTLESLRQSLEDGQVTVTRSDRTRQFPARFQLLAAANPCPCGANPSTCKCDAESVKRHTRRIAGFPFDRFDINTTVARPGVQDVEAGPLTSSRVVRERVCSARERQAARFAGEPGVTVNAQLTASATRRLLAPTEETRTVLTDGYRHGTLSLRDYDKCLRVARTIADLDASEAVKSEHISEALAFCWAMRDMGICS